MFRSVLAVIAGFLTMAICVGLFDTALGVVMPGEFPKQGEQRHPGDAVLLIEMAAGLLFAVFGGYVTAVAAKHSEALHAAALAALVLILGMVTLATQYESKPLWSHIGLMAVGVLGGLAGGWLRIAHKRRIPPTESPQP